MVTINSSKFQSKLQKYVFVHPDADIDPETSLPDDEDMYVITDVDELTTSGCPIAEDGVEYELWAILSPGETI